MLRTATTATAVTFCLMLWPVNTNAQERTQLVGVLTDPMGGLLSGVEVTLLEPGGKRRGRSRSDRAGRYEIKAVADGSYVIEVAVAGFRTLRRDIHLHGGTMRHDLALELGGLSERILVPRTAPVDPVPQDSPEAELKSCGGSFRPGELGGDLVPPRKTRDLRPVYPEPHRSTRTRGRAIVEGKLGLDGIIRPTRISATHDEFAGALMTALREWRIRPVRLNCQLFEMDVKIEADFVAGRSAPPASFQRPMMAGIVP